LGSAEAAGLTPLCFPAPSLTNSKRGDENDSAFISPEAALRVEKAGAGVTNQKSEAAVYQLKVSIDGAQPPLWRRVLVPADTTLGELHRVIQALMGWHDNHLHEFEAPRPGDTGSLTRRSRWDYRLFRSGTDPSGEPLDWIMDDGQEDEDTAVLADVAPCEKSHFAYIYDMGDHWEHKVTVEKILSAVPGAAYPVCLKGKRNGPVEDCGGVWGYEEMQEILADPAHPEHQDRKDWLEEVYGVSEWDGASFDLAAVNDRLKKLRRSG